MDTFDVVNVSISLFVVENKITNFQEFHNLKGLMFPTLNSLKHALFIIKLGKIGWKSRAKFFYNNDDFLNIK